MGKDVAAALGYRKGQNALAAHVDEEDKKDALIQGPLGGTQKMTIINESGLYSLILSSKLEQSRAFKRWVTSEVISSKNSCLMVSSVFFCLKFVYLKKNC